MASRFLIAAVCMLAGVLFYRGASKYFRIDIMKNAGIRTELDYSGVSQKLGIPESFLESFDTKVGWPYWGEVDWIMLGDVDFDAVSAACRLGTVKRFSSYEACVDDERIFILLSDNPCIKQVTACASSDLPLDSSLSRFSNCRNLAWLSIIGGRMSDTGVLALSKSQSIMRLSLHGKFVTDTSVPAICRMKSLRTLELMDNIGITEEGVRRILLERPEVEIVYQGKWLSSTN